MRKERWMELSKLQDGHYWDCTRDVFIQCLFLKGIFECLYHAYYHANWHPGLIYDVCLYTSCSKSLFLAISIQGHMSLYHRSAYVFTILVNWLNLPFYALYFCFVVDFSWWVETGMRCTVVQSLLLSILCFLHDCFCCFPLCFPTSHQSASSLSMLVADAAVFMCLRRSFLSSHVLYISMFVISVHLLKLFIYVVDSGSSTFCFPCIVPFIDIFHDVAFLVSYGMS